MFVIRREEGSVAMEEQCVCVPCVGMVQLAGAGVDGGGVKRAEESVESVQRLLQNCFQRSVFFFFLLC